MRFQLPSAGRVLTVASVLLVGGASVMAAEGKRAGKPLAGPAQKAPTTQPGGRTMSGEGRGELLRAAVDKAMTGVNPTDEQKVQIKKILDDHKAKMDAYKAQHAQEIKGIQDQIEAAKTAKDEAKLKELREKRMQLFAGAPRPKEVLDQIRNVLTDEQRKTFDANAEQVKADFEKNRPGGMTGEGRHGGDKAKGEHPRKNKEGGGDKNKLDI